MPPRLMLCVLVCSGCVITPRGVSDTPGTSLHPADQTSCFVYVRNESPYELDVRYAVHGQRSRQGSLGRLRPDRTASVAAQCMASVTATGTAPGGYTTSGTALAAGESEGSWIHLR